MYIYISILKSVYLGSDLLFKQVLLKTMEHLIVLLIIKDEGTFLIVILQVFLLFFLCRDPGGKGIAPYLLLKHFWPYLWSSSGVV